MPCIDGTLLKRLDDITRVQNYNCRIKGVLRLHPGACIPAALLLVSLHSKTHVCAILDITPYIQHQYIGNSTAG